MTREEAIRILDPETTIEALAEIEYYAGFSGPTAKVQAVDAACVIAVSDMRAMQELVTNRSQLNYLESDTINRTESDTVKGVEIDQFKNEPLSLEELRQMDCQPVWIPLEPPASVWALVSTGEGSPVFTFPEGEQCFIEEWLAEVGPVYRCEVPRL